MALDNIREAKAAASEEKSLRETLIKLSANQKELADAFLSLTRKMQQLTERVKKLE